MRLPFGVRDYLPAGASRRRRIVDACLAEVDRWGYQRIITPVFEYADVLARGGDGAQLRFVEPRTGEILALRTDITPQVARLAATRYGAELGPLRLSYEGSVIRLEGERGQREVLQVGAELITQPPEGAGVLGDLEAITLCAAALRAAGLQALHFDLSHPRLARALTAELPPELVPGVELALRHKDPDAVARCLGRARRGSVPAVLGRLLVALPELFGEAEVLAEARRLARGLQVPRVETALSELEALSGPLTEAAVPHGFDLGEVRGFDYYTGVRFCTYAEGHGEPLARGGRYDELCARYGRAANATGFAVEVEAVAAVQRAAGLAPQPPEGEAGEGVLLVADGAESAAALAALRARGQRAARWLGPPVSREDLAAYARRWGYARIETGAPGPAAPRRRRRST